MAIVISLYLNSCRVLIMRLWSLLVSGLEDIEDNLDTERGCQTIKIVQLMHWLYAIKGFGGMRWLVSNPQVATSGLSCNFSLVENLSFSTGNMEAPTLSLKQSGFF